MAVLGMFYEQETIDLTVQFHFNNWMEKQCFKCRETKPLSEFYRHPAMGDGRLGKCKTCTKRDTAERISRVAQDPKWVAKERARCRAKQKRYRDLGVAAKTSLESRRKWARNNPVKRKAEAKAKSAEKRGLIKKPAACEKCGATGRLEKHHPDYSQPLLVQYLCPKCHGETRWKDCPDIVP